MKNPITSAHVKGAAAGAILALGFVFVWPMNAVTGGGAQKMAAEASSTAVVKALAPICAAQFMGQPDAKVKTAALVATSSWDRGNILEKSGFATMPGQKSADSDVARACAEQLVTAAEKKG
jgi:hypothetical protein